MKRTGLRKDAWGLQLCSVASRIEEAGEGGGEGISESKDGGLFGTYMNPQFL